MKTRLAAGIGDEKALAAYQSLVERQASKLRNHFPTTVYFAPADAAPELSNWLGKEFDYAPQCEGDLGSRLKQAVSTAFDQGAKFVVCIGGDCPGLNASHIEQTLDFLSGGAAIVLGPTEDGGYYLIGLSLDRPELFEDIPWSQPETLDATLEKAHTLKLKPLLLETLYDIDQAEDLERARSEGLLSR